MTKIQGLRILMNVLAWYKHGFKSVRETYGPGKSANEGVPLNLSKVWMKAIPRIRDQFCEITLR